MSLTRNSGAKVAKISTQLKLNWTKFDTNMSGVLSNQETIRNLLGTSFELGGYANDFVSLSESRNLDELIKRHLLVKTNKALTMKEVQAIVKDLYGIRDTVENPVNLNNKMESAQIKAMRENYQLYYSNMKAMGKDKNWSDKQLAEALKDKEHGLKTYQNVS